MPTGSRSIRDRAAGIRPDGSVVQHGLAARRLTASGVAALTTLVVLLVLGVTSVSVAVDACWDAAALVFLVWVWFAISFKDAAETKRMAAAEDVSQPLADVILLCASVVSLVAVAFVLHQASTNSGVTKALLVTLALVSVALSWSTVHTLYTLRYGDLYYEAPVGGIDYHVKDPPDYLDLAYLAFTIGMTFQVSDTDLTARRIRRAATRHAMLSFLFGTVIVAVTINIVAGLLGK